MRTLSDSGLFGVDVNMDETAIRIEGVSKQYRLGGKQARANTLRDTLANAFVSPFRWVYNVLRDRTPSNASPDATIWALKDVSFDVKRGEVVGIIGRNGAGKSTLLKILSSITEPTEGSARIRGRVGSLLEVGTGFHWELTGRENIYLNGAILGMKKAEIDRKFDEIVAFAEVQKFIDTPVKHYSSGMYMRLAFAVAAHLEPEILIVDEVLSVGDAEFQKKCLGKVEEVAREGRTVLFVSHNMSAVTLLCMRTILFENGRIIEDGPTHKVINTYLSSNTNTTAERIWTDPSKAPKGEIVSLLAVRVRSKDGHVKDVIDIREPFRVEMEYDVLKPGYVLMPNFPFYNVEGVNVFCVHDVDPVWRRRPRPRGRYVSTVLVPGNLLAEGTMIVGAGMETIDPAILQFYEQNVVTINVIDNLDADSARGDYAGDMKGVMRPLLEWTTQFKSNSSKVDCL